jgi:arginyl-tRNA synthetase
MIEKILTDKVLGLLRTISGKDVLADTVTIQKTREDFEGDLTVIVFPLVRFTGRSPEETGKEIGEYLLGHVEEIISYNVVKGFLNLVISKDYWINLLYRNFLSPAFGTSEKDGGAPVVIEYSSPNTNKPLHLGHIRNNLLGWSVASILEAAGREVIKVNLVNDRGIHICKTMIAYREWAEGTDPHTRNIKGDKFVGDLYVKFEQANKEEISKGIGQGLTAEEAYRKSPLTARALEMLQQWENGDEEVRALWQRMNDWVYGGFDETYRRLGVDFDKIYHESDTYLLGKELVAEGVEKGVFYKKEDGSVWVDLSDLKLDDKLLLRADGTSVYITQDLGTAQLRYDDYHPEELLYVVGNEQNYHFEVLKAVLKKLGRPWAEQIVHVSYGMVELPHGRMKSREGTVVDADDLMQEMHRTAEKMTKELGKWEDYSVKEADILFEMIGMGALKYFILKVDPKKNMTFNPEESIDFNGNTGPFIQYTHARIRSLLSKAGERGFSGWGEPLSGLDSISEKERSVMLLLNDYPQVVREAAHNLSPAMVANYVYELAREYNQFYQELPVLKEKDQEKVKFRLALSDFTARVIKKALGLLGIDAPEKM